MCDVPYWQYLILSVLHEDIEDWYSNLLYYELDFIAIIFFSWLQWLLFVNILLKIY